MNESFQAALAVDIKAIAIRCRIKRQRGEEEEQEQEREEQEQEEQEEMFEPRSGHCVVFLGKTLYSDFLSPPRCINGYLILLRIGEGKGSEGEAIVPTLITLAP